MVELVCVYFFFDYCVLLVEVVIFYVDVVVVGVVVGCVL